MKERPILFSGSMVRAILQNRKTQTRRVIKSVDPHWPTRGSIFPATNWTFERGNESFIYKHSDHLDDDDARTVIACPYGSPGDRLWVRETWYDDFGLDRSEIEVQLREDVYYRADGEAHDQFEDWADLKWRPPIFMPRWASRIALEITNVRVERLQDITPDGALAEGAYEDLVGDIWPEPRGLFRRLWDRINGKTHPWKSNPWVWVIEFTRVKP